MARVAHLRTPARVQVRDRRSTEFVLLPFVHPSSPSDERIATAR